MPKALTRYTVLLSAPGDAARECDIADEELQKINRTHSGETGIEFYPTDWKRDSRADSGDEPQKLLNKQIVEDADIILAIFKERFGTPTSQYSSGTEEEIMLGFEMGKRVLVYFWEPGDGFTPSDVDQFAKIVELKQRLQNKTVYKTFGDDVKLGSSIRHDFTKMLFELEGGAISAKPQLTLAGIADDKEIAQGSAPLVYPIVLNRLNRLHTMRLSGRHMQTFSQSSSHASNQPRITLRRRVHLQRLQYLLAYQRSCVRYPRNLRQTSRSFHQAL